jgi:hypothetical protein
VRLLSRTCMHGACCCLTPIAIEPMAMALADA